jgi:hypothetical protein
MRRISLEEIRRDVEIQIRCLRGPTKTALQTMNGDRAAEQAARTIVERCLGGCVVLAPDMVSADSSIGSWGERPGKFGVDEPWPFEKGHKPPK